MPQERTAAEIPGRDFPTGETPPPADPVPATDLLRARLSAGGTVGDAAPLLERVALQRGFEPVERPRSTP